MTVSPGLTLALFVSSLFTSITERPMLSISMATAVGANDELAARQAVASKKSLERVGRGRLARAPSREVGKLRDFLVPPPDEELLEGPEQRDFADPMRLGG